MKFEERPVSGCIEPSPQVFITRLDVTLLVLITSMDDDLKSVRRFEFEIPLFAARRMAKLMEEMAKE